MLSKEKTKNTKLSLNEYLKIYKDLKDNISLIESIKLEPFIEFIELLLARIEQLETGEQKLIEKLEEEHTKAKTEFSNTLSPYQYGRLDVIENILEILKGEKE